MKNPGLILYETLAAMTPRERIFSGFYKIRDKSGKIIDFVPNVPQTIWYDNWHIKTITLKARQAGISTVAGIKGLDRAIFVPGQTVVIVANSKENAKDLYEKIIKNVYDCLPEELKAVLKIEKDKDGEISFGAIKSKIIVSLSGRGGTSQMLHISEYGKVCAKDPEKAKEIKTGSLNTISPEGEVIIESTAEGAFGDFYEKCQRAIDNEGKVLTNMDYKFIFLPWFIIPEFVNYSNEPIREDTKEYFEKLKGDKYISKVYKNIDEIITPARMLWYQKKKEEQGDEMWREYPSTPKEAFAVSLKGAYFDKEVSKARAQQRVCRIPWDDRLPVYTVWDIGGASETGDLYSIIFFQKYGKEVRIIDTWSGNGMSLIEICNTIVLSKRYWYCKHYFPHDAQVAEKTTGITRFDSLRELLGDEKCEIIPKKGLADGINDVRNVFPMLWFNDNTEVEEFLNHIASYSKKWDSVQGMFKDEPNHDKHSHAADSLRYMAIVVLDLFQMKRDNGGMFIMDPLNKGFINQNSVNRVVEYNPFGY